MSLINQMLRDLDRRHASAAERAGLSGQVKALPPARRLPRTRWLPMAAGGAGALVLAVFIASLLESQPWRLAGPAISAPVVVATAPPQPSPAVAMPPLVVPMPSIKAATVVAPASAPVSARKQRVAEGTVPASGPVPVPDVAAPAPAVEPSVAIDKRPRGQVGGDGAEAEYRQGITAHRQGRPTDAFARFQSALTADSHHAAARQALLSMLMAERRWAEAQTVASEGLALDATQFGWAMALARLQFEQGQLAEAERTMATHRRYGERSPDYLAFHGLLLEKLDRREEARAAFQRARDTGKLSPELAEAIEPRLR